MIQNSDLSIVKACSALEIDRGNYYNWIKFPEKMNPDNGLTQV